MRTLKRLFLYLLLLAVVAIGGVIIIGKIQQGNRAYAPFTKPCRAPIKYSIGSIDPRFNITPDQFKDLISQAVAVWDKASGGLDLFTYDPNASLKIQLVYDERQQSTNEANQLESDLKTLETKQATLGGQYSGLNKQYNQKLAAFKAALADYQSKLGDYNSEVSGWNKKGGAPADIYNKLKKEQNNLDDDFAALKKQESDLKNLASQINTIAAQENKIVNNYNAAVTTYQNKYGGSREFEKGVFDPSQGIAIYQFEGLDDLRLTLAHELGHALGMQHVQNSQSIMYYLMGDQNLENPTPTAEDMAELKNICQL